MRTRRLLLSLTLAAGAFGAAAGCGDNAFEKSKATAEPQKPADQATLDLEKNDPTDAINILTAALAKDPGNVQYLSILSLAYAQSAGLDPLSFALNLATLQSQGTSVSASGVPTGNTTALFAILPDATQANLDAINNAVTTITEIPAAERQTYDTFKYALFQTASMLLTLKSVETNPKGITEALATTLLGQLGAAAAALGANPSDATSQQLAQAITQYQAQIAAQGGSAQQQLQNFLANGGTIPSTVTFTGTGTGTGTGT